MKEKASPSDKRTLRNFGLATGGIIASVFGLIFPWYAVRNYPLWPWIVSAFLVVPALVLPAMLGPLYRVWMKVGHGLGWINSRIILAILFYGVLTPTGLFMRLLGKKPLQLKRDRQADSYRIKSDPLKKEHVEKPF